MLITKYEQRDINTYYDFKDKLQNHIIKRSEEAFLRADKVRGGISSCEELEEYSEDMRQKFIDSLGGIPYDKNYPLNAVTTGVIEEEYLKIEKVIFESRKGVFVTGNLYLPKDRPEKCGAVLFQCGHSHNGKAYDRYQRAIRTIASSGLIVFAIDPVGQGERVSYVEDGVAGFQIPPTTPEHQHIGEQCFLTGKPLTRYFIADAMRAVDYLETRPEVDNDKIGATGNSGGGTATCHMMVCDKRIKAAAPGTFVTNRREYLYSGNAQDDEQIWFGATDYGFDHNECFLCFAPKPAMILAVDSDFFVIEGTKEVYEKSKKAWEFYGKADDFHLVIDKRTHCYSDPLAIEAGKFFSRVLNGTKKSYIKEAVKPLDERELYATKTGNVRRDISGAKIIFEENLESLNEYEKSYDKKKAKDFLRQCVDFGRVPCELNMRRPSNGEIVEYGFGTTEYMWFSQKQMPAYALAIRSISKMQDDAPVVICLFDSGTDDLEGHIYKIRQLCNDGKRVVILDLTATGKNMPYLLHYGGCDDKMRFGAIDRMTKNLFYLGDSLCALRLFELEYAFSALKAELKTEDISLYAEGKSKILADLYSLLHEEVNVTTGLGDSLYDIATTKYYEEYNCAGYLIPGILKYIKI